MANNNTIITPSFNLRSILEKEKLNGSNFLDWHRNLRIVLMHEKKEFVIDTPIPELPEGGGTAAERAAQKRHQDASNDVKCVMLATMSPDLQKQFLNSDAYTMNLQLKNLFQEQARVEQFAVTKEILSAKLGMNQPVGPFVLKLIRLFEQCERLGLVFPTRLQTDIILHSLPESFDNFKMNFNMNGMENTVTELHGMLKSAEGTIKENCSKDVLLVKKGNGFKKYGTKNGGSKGKKPSGPKQPPAKKQKVVKDPSQDTCFYCNDKGHWKN